MYNCTLVSCLHASADKPSCNCPLWSADNSCTHQSVRWNRLSRIQKYSSDVSVNTIPKLLPRALRNDTTYATFEGKPSRNDVIEGYIKSSRIDDSSYEYCVCNVANTKAFSTQQDLTVTNETMPGHCIFEFKLRQEKFCSCRFLEGTGGEIVPNGINPGIRQRIVC
jgi:hypothetical protein